LKSRNSLKDFVDIADPEIIKHRSEYDLNNFVPFHFFASTPFAGSVQRGHEEMRFIYLTINRSLASKNNFKIIPRHPLNFKESPLSYEDGFEQIDWELLSSRDYQDHNCKEACMAECIFEKIIPFKHISFIYVKNDHDYNLVKTKIVGKETHPNFAIFKNEGMFVK